MADDTTDSAATAPAATAVAADRASAPRRARRSGRAKPASRAKARKPADGEVAARRARSADQTVPYVMAYGNITKVLNAIATASTPDRFTLDYLANKLAMTGGSARPVIPFLKRVGFLSSDGTPTDLYKRFRNPTNKSQALAEATHQGYKSLYEVNEHAHELKPADLRGLAVQVTGLDPNSSTIQAIVGSFNALRAGANFDANGSGSQPDTLKNDDRVDANNKPTLKSLNLGYTINLHLPATSDIAVFNAIFKSLREHLLGE